MIDYKYAVIVPYFGGRDGEHIDCMLPLHGNVPIVMLSNVPYIDMARAQLAKVALQQPVDYLMWIDQDIIFTVKDIEKIVAHCAESDYDILGAAYAKKTLGQDFVGRLTKDVINTVDTIDFYLPGLYDAEFVGLGFTVIKRKVFIKLQDTLPLVDCPAVDSKLYPYFHHLIEDGNYFGEDVSFCKRALRAGFKIGIDVEPRIFHKGAYKYTLWDCDEKRKNLFDVLQVRLKVPE